MEKRGYDSAPKRTAEVDQVVVKPTPATDIGGLAAATVKGPLCLQPALRTKIDGLKRSPQKAVEKGTQKDR